ncbi:MAG: hypothetical protein AAF228_02595 [Pseudomonadota bacterium]
MFDTILLSIGIGLAFGITIMYIWPTLCYMFLASRCKKLVTQFFVRIGLDDKDKSLSRLCSKKLINKIAPTCDKVRSMGRLNVISKAQIISLTKLSQSTDKAVMRIEAYFQKGKLQAQVTIAANKDIAEIREFNIV